MNELQRCVEQIRVAFNASPNVRRARRTPKIEETTSLKKIVESEYTGFFGLYSPRSKKFIFGIQEPTRAAVEERAKKKLGKHWKQNFEVRKIRRRDADDFLDGLRRQDDEQG